ncbi:hypothetical protein BV917_16810 [Leptospira santarosai serovar Guaricura]|nr:hypothetical protein BV917_16810 [Leptospira santarosai serovar Guaricura]
MGRVWKLSETLPELSISLPKGRSIGRVWELSETLPKGRVSGSYYKALMISRTSSKYAFLDSVVVWLLNDSW